MPEPAVQPDYIHATALLAGDRGILITGPSGSGKTTLALALISHLGQRGLFTRLIGDDQLIVDGRAGRLVCRAPLAIAGLAEVAGIGPRPLPYESAAVIDLHVRLVEEGVMDRFQEDASDLIAGCPVSRIDLVRRGVSAALQAVTARLSIVPFL